MGVRPLVLLVLAGACRWFPDGLVGPDTGAGSALPTEEPASILDGTCVAPADAVPNPLERTGRVQINEGSELDEFVMDILEVEVDFELRTAWAAGQGGIVTFDLTEADPVYTTRWWAELDDGLDNPRVERFHHLERMDGTTLVATHRNEGFFIVQHPPEDPTAPLHEVGRHLGENYNGVVTSDGEAWFSKLDGTIERWNLEDRANPELVATLDGFGHPWDLRIDAHKLYVVDNDYGLVIVDDANDRDRPMKIVGSVPTGGSPQDVAVEEGYAFVANGAAGVTIVDIRVPEAPVVVATFDVGSSVVSVDYTEALLWAVAHEQVFVLDVSDPEHPLPLGSYPTPEWGLSVDAEGTEGVVGDWGNVEVFSIDRDARAPDVYHSPGEVQFYDGGGSIPLTLQNQGAGTLELRGGSVGDSRVDARATTTSLAPGESATIEVSFADDGAPLDTTLCLVTNDGDEPLVELPVARGVRGNGEMVVGEQAWDFALQDLDGVWHSLTDEVNHTVFLIFFATW